MQKILGITLAGFVALAMLTACGDDAEHSDKKRDAVISKDCTITAKPTPVPGIETGFKNEVSETGDAKKDKVAADFVEYWRRYFLATQAVDVKGSCVKVYISTSRQNIDAFVADLEEKNERYVGYATMVSVSNIKIAGDEATLKACLDQGNSHRVNKDNEPVEAPPGQTELSATLVEIDGLWRIAEQRAVGSC